MFELTSLLTDTTITKRKMESINNNAYKTAALKLARKICTEAIWHKEQCNWLTLSSENNYQYPTDYAKMMGNAFYDGIAGIILFLTATYSVEKDSILKETIEGAIKTLQLQNSTDIANENYGSKLSLHTGFCGSAYVMDYAGEVLESDSYKKEALALLTKTTTLSIEHFGTDVIDGAAGAIPVYLYFYNKTNNTIYLNFAISLGDYLLKKATTTNGTISWNTMPEIEQHLTGYAHGTAGMAHCFAELYAATNNEEYRSIVQQIVAYETQHFNKQEKNWPDFRNFSNENKESSSAVCSCAWCHGAPGIGLSRIRCYTLLGDAAYLEDAIAAAFTTKKNNVLHYGYNFSLCHGLTGNGELLEAMYTITNDASWKQAVLEITDVLSKDFIANNKVLPSGLQYQKPVLDFMLGDAGIGYFLLRQYDAEKFKNMLLFTAEK